MFRSIFCRFRVALPVWLVGCAAAGLVRASDLSKEISPLVKADFEAARLVVGNLEQLAAEQTGNEKVRTQRLATAIRNLFTAEFRVAEAVKAAAAAERQARQHEKTAAEWLKPNVFGRTNPPAAEEARGKAKEVRRQAAGRIAGEREEMVRHAREVEVVMRNFHDLGDVDVVIVLGEALSAVTTRALGPGAFTPSFSAAALAAMKQSAAMRNQWRDAARAAEAGNLPERALRFHVMSGDLAAARAAAAALVPELLEAGLHGSAIEALEIAGDFPGADQLRAAHPAPSAAAFRKLDPEELAWRLASTCVRVSSGKAHGAGFLCRRDGHVLTVAAALAGRDAPVTVQLADERTFTARLVGGPDDAGLALLRIPLGRHQTLSLGTNADLQAGAAVVLPALAAAAPDLIDGRLADGAPPAGAPPVVRVALVPAALPAGTPLADARGRVLGMLRAARTAQAGQPAEAIPADALAAFLRDHAGAGFSFE